MRLYRRGVADECRGWKGEPADRIRRAFGEVQVDYIGRAAFMRNKRAMGRAKDLGDIEGLE